MLHPITLWHALKDAGMTCRVKEGKLLINPIASLAGELREQVIAHRAALVAWLEGADEDDARIDALAAETARCNPFDHPEPEGRGGILVRVNLEGEPPRFVAIDPDYWRDLCQWAAEVRQINAKRPPKKAERTKKAQR